MYLAASCSCRQAKHHSFLPLTSTELRLGLGHQKHKTCKPIWVPYISSVPGSHGIPSFSCWGKGAKKLGKAIHLVSWFLDVCFLSKSFLCMFTTIFSRPILKHLEPLVVDVNWRKCQPNIASLISIHHMGVSKNRGTPKSSIFIGVSITNHPFWGPTPIFGNTHISINITIPPAKLFGSVGGHLGSLPSVL